MPEEIVVSRANPGVGDTARRPLTRVLAAALRLAAVYGVGVSVLLALVIVPVILTDDAVLRFREAVGVVSIPFFLTFAVAFLVLAMTRRFGFALAWLALLALWGIALRSEPTALAPESFLLWSVLAAPLFAMVMIGVPSSASPRGRGVALGVTLVWVALFVANELALVQLVPVAGAAWGSPAGRARVIATLAAPVAISAVALWRLRPLFTRQQQHAG
jgi:hypothetical protein